MKPRLVSAQLRGPAVCFHHSAAPRFVVCYGEMFDKLWRREKLLHTVRVCRFVLMFSLFNFMFPYKGTEVEIKSTARAIYLIFNSSTQTALLHVSLNDLEEGFVFTATMLRRLPGIEYHLSFLRI